MLQLQSTNLGVNAQGLLSLSNRNLRVLAAHHFAASYFCGGKSVYFKETNTLVTPMQKRWRGMGFRITLTVRLIRAACAACAVCQLLPQVRYGQAGTGRTML